VSRRRRDALWSAGFGLAVGLIGLAWADAVLAGLIGFVLLTALSEAVAAVRGADPARRWPRHRPAPRDGARREVGALSWAFAGRPGLVSEEAVRRLRADAARRLARHGVVLPGGLNAGTPRSAAPDDVVRARALLGEPAWTVLTSPGGVMPSLADAARCVEAVERLAPPPVDHRSEGQPS